MIHNVHYMSFEILNTYVNCPNLKIEYWRPKTLILYLKSDPIYIFNRTKYQLLWQHSVASFLGQMQGPN